MRRLLDSPIAKRPSFDTAQYKCPCCDREVTLLGRSQNRAKLRTPKCRTTVMERVHYAENIKEPPAALIAKLDAAKGTWAIVNVVPGNPAKHAERPAGASPELADRGYAYRAPIDDCPVPVSRTLGRIGERRIDLNPGETLGDALKRGMHDAGRVLQSGRNPRR